MYTQQCRVVFYIRQQCDVPSSTYVSSAPVWPVCATFRKIAKELSIMRSHSSKKSGPATLPVDVCRRPMSKKASSSGGEPVVILNLTHRARGNNIQNEYLDVALRCYFVILASVGSSQRCQAAFRSARCNNFAVIVAASRVPMNDHS